MDKITIITATYNLIENSRKNHFEQMFESVRIQTYTNIEHLIIDGASSDGTLELIQNQIKEHKAENVRIISEPDTGIYNAFNKGIKNSTGNYIIFLNSDDYYLESNTIELLYDAIESNSVVYAYCQLTIGLEDRDVPYKNMRHYYFRQVPFGHNTLLCKKSLFDKYGLFDESYKIAADCEFMFNLCLYNEKYSYVDQSLVYFRNIGVSSSDLDFTHNEIARALKNTIYKEASSITSDDILNLMIFESNHLITLRKAFDFIFQTKSNQVKLLLVKFLLKPRIKRIIQLRFILKPIETYIKRRKAK